jgi:parallel beta-helix repeat protein
MSNPGTAAQPWSTLEAVLAAKKAFKGGDKILLRRGNHGSPVISGSGAGASAESRVVILAEAGHAPVLKSLVFHDARFWQVQDLFINAEVPGEGDPKSLITFRKKSTDNVVLNVGAWGTQDPLGWAANEAGWTNGYRNGIYVDIGGGSNNRIEGSFFLNLRNGFNLNAPENTIISSVIENFTIDGVRPNAPRQKLYYNIIMNAVMNDHTKPYGARQHRDMMQAIGPSKDGVELIGNIWIAVADPALPVCGIKEVSPTKYMEPFAPAIAGWDGPFQDWRIENNVIFTNHVTGIWLNGATNCRVVNNTVVKLTDTHPSHKPSIKIAQKGSKGGKSEGNHVYNNIAVGDFEFKNSDGSTTVSGAGCNITVPWAMAQRFFLARGLPALDARLRPNAAAINCANPAFAPELDADGLKRKAPDIGAYEFGPYPGPDTTPPSAPGKPQVTVIPGLGADVQWSPSTDNRKVMGYDIYRNKVRVGRTRTGARFFDFFAGSTATFTGDPATLTYVIRAFDMSSNGTLGPSGTPKSGK